MERIIFVNGKYHSQFQIFDQASFLNSFCINNGFEESEVVIKKLPNATQQTQINSKLASGRRLSYENGKAVLYKKLNGNEVIDLQIELEQG